MAPPVTCCFCGPVKNCARFLPQVFANIEKIGNDVFDGSFHVVVFYDASTDGTLHVLRKLQAKYGRERLDVIVNTKPPLPYRTHRIAKARNACLRRIDPLTPFFVMMDFDDVNCKRHVDTKLLRQHLTSCHDWDALSFHTAPAYYDIWALSIYPFCFSYNHFRNTPIHNYHVLQKHVTRKLALAAKRNELLQCLSAFNGFAIYRTHLFLSAKYDGRVRTDLLPPALMHAHQHAAKSPLIAHDYGHVNGQHEDCEHRAFHLQAIQQSNARIRISPQILFT
jgi:glycosyltransferase involved in cell wall biosynthesis